MINIKKYHELLKNYDIKEDNGHLIIENRTLKPREKHEIINDLFSALGDTRANDSRFRLRKSKRCKFDNCVSPQCYSFIVKTSLTKRETSLLSKEDIEQIASEMDLDKITMVGPKEYLKQYNESLPDFLKITEEDFKTIYAYMKGLK